MHCDYLNLTVPASRSYEVERLVTDRLTLAGAVRETPEILRLNGGTCRFRERARFTCISFSGAVLEALRSLGALADLLHSIGSGPHKVTLMHVALDIQADAPPLLQKLQRKARAGNVRLTRKSISPRNVTFMQNHNYSSPGVVTGSLYLGARSAEARLLVYDKRNERLDKGLPDPGPLTRYELSVSGKLGATLRDVMEPHAMYWHFMSNTLAPPANTPPWEPQADGYALEPPTEPLPFAVLERMVETSPDLRRALELSEALGPHGWQMLISMLDRKRRTLPDQPADSQTGT